MDRKYTGEYVQGQNRYRSDGKMIPWPCRKCRQAGFWRKDDLARHQQSGCSTKGTAPTAQERAEEREGTLTFKPAKK